MRTSLLLETNQYQVFDLGYGLCLVNRTPDIDVNKDVFRNVLFQGDDSIEFEKEITNIEKVGLDESKTNYLLSQYELVMNNSFDNEYFQKLGMNVSKSKPKF